MSEPVQEINGWKPPIIYDAAMNQSHIVTQQEVDQMQHDRLVLAECIRVCERAIEECRVKLGWKKA